jgi:hypothetical protein
LIALTSAIAANAPIAQKTKPSIIASPTVADQLPQCAGDTSAPTHECDVRPVKGKLPVDDDEWPVHPKSSICALSSDSTTTSGRGGFNHDCPVELAVCVGHAN